MQISTGELKKSTGELKKMAGVSKQFNMYRPMRPSQILLSKKKVTEVAQILEEFINPFGVGYKHYLYNLSSRKEVPDDLTSAILDVLE